MNTQAGIGDANADISSWQGGAKVAAHYLAHLTQRGYEAFSPGQTLAYWAGEGGASSWNKLTPEQQQWAKDRYVGFDPAKHYSGPGQPESDRGIATRVSQALDHPSPDGVLQPDGDNVEARWTAARDANIRPYLHWRPGAPVTLPVLNIRASGNRQQQPRPQHGHQHPGHNGQGRGGRPGFNGKGPFNGGGGGGGGGRRRRGRDRDRERDRHRGGGGDFNRNRDRGPRLPGFYNPGGD